jgi:hypothetical protein
MDFKELSCRQGRFERPNMLRQVFSAQLCFSSEGLAYEFL